MKLHEAFSKFGRPLGGRSYAEKVRDEEADLNMGQPSPTNFLGRNGSRSTATRNGTYSIQINGKIWQRDGQPVTFSDMYKASAVVAKIKARAEAAGKPCDIKVINGAR